MPPCLNNILKEKASNDWTFSTVSKPEACHQNRVVLNRRNTLFLLYCSTLFLYDALLWRSKKRIDSGATCAQRCQISLKGKGKEKILIQLSRSPAALSPKSRPAVGRPLNRRGAECAEETADYTPPVWCCAANETLLKRITLLWDLKIVWKTVEHRDNATRVDFLVTTRMRQRGCSEPEAAAQHEAALNSWCALMGIGGTGKPAATVLL